MTDDDWLGQIAPDGEATGWEDLVALADDALLVYADWLEDRGRNGTALAARWLAGNGHSRPKKCRASSILPQADADDGPSFDWKEYLTPPPVFCRLEPSGAVTDNWANYVCFREYHTPLDAVVAFLRAYERALAEGEDPAAGGKAEACRGA